MFKKFLCAVSIIFMLGMNINTKAQTAYTFDGAFFSYGTINLTTGAFTSINFTPQGSSYYPQTADNKEVDAQYAIMSDFGFPATYYLSHVNFTTLTADSIGIVGPLASGQNVIKGMAYNVVNDMWYVVSGNDFGSAAYLYTLDITTGGLTVVGQIQNADLPVGMAIDCNGNAYIVNIEIGISATAVLNSLNLTTAVATAIGTDLGLADVSVFSQDMDFNPDNGNLYWSGYWSSGFFSEGGSFRLVDVTNGTSTEISTFGQFETITGFNVNGICPPPPPTPAESYTFNGAFFSYGTINLTTGAFTSINFTPQGSSYYPQTADNKEVDAQYAIMSDFGFPATYYLSHVNFTTLTADSIGIVGPLASGQNVIKGMAYNVINDMWYVVSGNDFGSAAYLYTLDITTGGLTVVGQIQNADLPVGMAIDCNGNAYIVNIEIGISATAVLNSLDLTTAEGTAIGTDLGLANVSAFSQDMDFNPDNGNLYWSGYWSSGFFSEGGSFRLVDVTNGTSTEISTFGQFETITGFNVNGICSPAATFQFSVNVTNGWNMVSAPGLNTPNQNVGTWWPNLTGTVWEFNGTIYEARTVTTPGEGYWMKNVGAETYSYTGIEIVTHDAIPATAGWNLIGGYEISVATAGLTTINPTGQQTGTIWGFNGTIYEAATTFEPGKGYWVKTLSACDIVIPEVLAKGSGEVVELFKSDWGKIILTDAAGKSYTLYAVKGEVDLDQYEMPPAVPGGMFDIRFSSGRIAEDINSSMQSIDMSGITYPLTVSVENMDISLQDESGEALNAELRSGDRISIANASIHKLFLKSGEIATPVNYDLEQNYPNPFNPSTTIKYSVPADGFVNIAVYNVLGEKIADIVNNIQKSGNYELTFDARNLASGMYIYRMESGNFVSVKKMMILK